MKRSLLALVWLAPYLALAQPVRTGDAAYGDWSTDAPGVTRRIAPDALPPPYATRSSAEGPSMARQPSGMRPRLPPGFAASLFAEELETPRTLRTAPNGDVFVVESSSGKVTILRDPKHPMTFAHGLVLPFGLAFWPPGPSPSYLYVGETNRVVRYPYRNGEVKPSGPMEVVVSSLPGGGGHWTRDVVFSPDGRTMFVSVGSLGNIASDLSGAPPVGSALGAAWNENAGRADVLAFSPTGSEARVFATGLRNCSAEAIQPATGKLWCAVNERDGLGDNLPPDYVTSVRDGAFYGWPWYYIGNHPDPRLKGQHSELADRVTVPEVLLQPHSAPLGLAFYDGAQFPAEYRGDAFVALHGSWNRAKRTGYKVVRLRFQDGRPTGEYEDFMTGLVASKDAVWARPVGLTVMRDGSLLVSEDGNGTVWRISWSNQP